MLGQWHKGSGACADKWHLSGCEASGQCTNSDSHKSDDRANPVTYADEQKSVINVVNVKRCKWLKHLDQNGKAAGFDARFSSKRCPSVRSAESRQLRVTSNVSCIRTEELSNCLTCQRAGRENASVQQRGRRRRSSQTLGCNGQDRVKDRQGKSVETEGNGCRKECWKTAVATRAAAPFRWQQRIRPSRVHRPNRKAG